MLKNTSACHFWPIFWYKTVNNFKKWKIIGLAVLSYSMDEIMRMHGGIFVNSNPLGSYEQSHSTSVPIVPSFCTYSTLFLYRCVCFHFVSVRYTENRTGDRDTHDEHTFYKETPSRVHFHFLEFHGSEIEPIPRCCPGSAQFQSRETLSSGNERRDGVTLYSALLASQVFSTVFVDSELSTCTLAWPKYGA